MDVHSDVTELVAGAARGDQQAWRAIVDRYLPLVFSVTRAHRLRDSDAEDVNQTVWLRLVEHLDELREPRALPKWIMTTARHESLRLIKARRREQPLDPLVELIPDGADAGLDAELLRAERQQALRDGLAELAPAHRRLLVLLVADPPLSYHEISQLLDIPVGSIGPTRARCLARLRATSAMRAFAEAEGPADEKRGDRVARAHLAQRR